jgi:hypothetical protein
MARQLMTIALHNAGVSVAGRGGGEGRDGGQLPAAAAAEHGAVLHRVVQFRRRADMYDLWLRGHKRARGQ